MDAHKHAIEDIEDEVLNPSSNPSIGEVMAAMLSRRSTLKGGLGLGAATVLGGMSLTACGGSTALNGNSEATGAPAAPQQPGKAPLRFNFEPVAKTQADQMTLPEGYQMTVLHALGDPMHWGDNLWGDQGTESAESYQRRIGDGHDGMYYFGLADDGKFDPTRSDRGLLCVNHEYVVPPYVLHPQGRTQGAQKKAEEVKKEIYAHGMSVVEVKRDKGANMKMVRGSKYNRRVHSATAMDMRGPARGSALLVNKLSKDGTEAFGMNNNCACGYTPWGTYLTCEENFRNVFGRSKSEQDVRSAKEEQGLKRYGLASGAKNGYGWDIPEGEEFRRWNSVVSAEQAADDYRNTFNTFGWVVEIDPFRPESKPVKRSWLGRFAHEGAWPAPAHAGEPIVIYSGDDSRFEYVYKFVSDAKWDPRDKDGGTAVGSKYLDHGKLYVAKFNADGTGEWVELTYGKNGLDASNSVYPFADQADVLIHARLAGDAVGATKMDRPEWGGVNPVNREVYMTMTNNNQRKEDQLHAANPRAGNVNGHIVRWKEEGGQAGTQFRWDVYLFGARADDKGNANLSGLTHDNDFSSPDGLHFDQRLGNTGLLWIQTDDSNYMDVTNDVMLAALPGQVGDGKTITLPNGQVTHLGAQPTSANLRRFLVGPKWCEITGVVVTPDGKTLFVNVQHPGEKEGAPGTYTSGWPGNQVAADDTMHAGFKRPRSATVVVTRTDGGTIAI